MKRIDMMGIIAVRHIRIMRRQIFIFIDAKCNWNDKRAQKAFLFGLYADSFCELLIRMKKIISIRKI